MLKNKSADLKKIDEFISVLERFSKEKKEKWEKIDEQIQANNNPATPTEDWIIPPDEQETEIKLMEDPSYRELKAKIHYLKKDVKKIALFLDQKEAHALDWLNFKSPLIGNAALEDGIGFAKNLKKQCNSTNYLLHSIKRYFC